MQSDVYHITNISQRFNSKLKFGNAGVST